MRCVYVLVCVSEEEMVGGTVVGGRVVGGRVGGWWDWRLGGTVVEGVSNRGTVYAQMHVHIHPQQTHPHTHQTHALTHTTTHMHLHSHTYNPCIYKPHTHICAHTKAKQKQRSRYLAKPGCLFTKQVQ